MTNLKIQDLSFRYTKDTAWLLENFNFETESGDIIAVKGSSGSGKTTLLNILCGVIPKMISGDFHGKVFISHEDLKNLSLPQISPKISLLMQEPENQLFFPLVELELAFGPENLLVEPEKIKRRIDDSLQKLEIEDLRFENTADLSFGQKKLIAFTSLLTLSPDIYLLDEPSAGLSDKYVQIMKNIITELSRSGKIIFIADHMEKLLEISNKEINLNNSSSEERSETGLELVTSY
ncbi:MAG TPA: ABC transporter ATP-binding protein [Candidatus Cloacimonetes bacterium]|nr:ABC transporter ATP-binding protein [Candidatus Cloacimonadota bacterium]